MIVQKIPRFERGNVLSQEMLETLRQGYILNSTFDYLGYANGILKGFRITASDEYLVVGKGNYIFDNQLLYVNEEVKIPYIYGNTVRLLVLRTSDKETSRCFEIREAEIKLISEEDKLLTDIEICRFCIQKGAQLRDNINKLDDMSTFFNTVCMCYAQWSALDGQTVAYPILYQFANELVLCKNRTSEDNVIISQVYATKGESLAKKYVESYLFNKLQREAKLDTPYMLYCGLRDVLRNIQRGNTHQIERRAFPDRRVIID